MPRVFGKPFVAGPLPPQERLAEARRAVEAGEMNLSAAAQSLERAPGWMARYSKANGWLVPSRLRRAERAAAKPKRAGKPGGSAGLKSRDRAARIIWRAVRVLTAKLKTKLADGAPDEEIIKDSTAINKLVADTRRNGLKKGDEELTGDTHDHSGASLADTADGAPSSAEDLARLRSDLVAAIADVLATYSDPPGSGEAEGHATPPAQ